MHCVGLGVKGKDVDVEVEVDVEFLSFLLLLSMKHVTPSLKSWSISPFSLFPLFSPYHFFHFFCLPLKGLHGLGLKGGALSQS